MTSNSTVEVTTKERDAFYAGAIAGMRVLDPRKRSPRRVGKDADSRWASFRGALSHADRIDFLLRDAAVTWGVAFSPAAAFGLFSLAPDEPFRPDWQSLTTSAAQAHLESEEIASTPAEIGKLLGIEPDPCTPRSKRP